MKNLPSNIALVLSLIVATLLSSCHDGYEKKDGQVYHKWFHGGNWTKEYTLIEEADAETFETIDHNLNLDLAKDKNHVFKDAAVLENADPKTFVQVKNYFWKDKNHVFLIQFGGTKCIIELADPSSFQVIENYLWSIDRSHVFYKFDLLKGVNPKEFSAINEEWGKDNHFYYWNNLRVDSLDYESAEIVSDYYILDSQHVYFKNVIVNGANPKTFKADGVGWFGHDDKNMYDWAENKGPITEKYRQTYIDKK